MIRLIPSLFFTLFIYSACTQHTKTAAHANYDLARPEILKMPSGLDEISGIAFNKGRPDTMYAEQDEEGRIFYFPLASLDVKHRKFGKKGDYEDIAICNETAVILRSDGVLFSFPLNVAGEESVSDVQENTNMLSEGEYEGMYGDEASGQLYILCKDCKADNANKSISGYILQLNAGKAMQTKDGFQINTKEIAEKLGEKKIAFRPSALAKNSRENQWYIVSSVNKLLVITDDKWVVRQVLPLDPALFSQPEGIAFDKDDNMYISNERGGASNATVLKFAYTNNNK